MRPRIEVRLLGPFELLVGGEAVHIGSVKQRAVLAVLALHAGKVVSSDTLCDVVWAKDQPVSLSATLHSVISRLRSALRSASGPVDAGSDALRTRGAGWVLDLEADALDALRFAHLTGRARQRTGRGEVAAAANDLAEAVALWRGAALVDIVDAGYLGAQATRLNEARLDAVEDLAEAQLATGNSAAALTSLEEHVEANPLRERAWGLLMIALYRLGRPATALRAFQQVRTVLGEELGLTPSPELVEIEGRILRHDPSLLPPPSRVARVWPSADTAAAEPATPPGAGVQATQAVPGVRATQAVPGVRATQAVPGVRATQAGEFGDYAVLVVEDHDFQRRTVLHLLRGLGVGTLREAANGTEALAILAAGHVPDIILCDIDMPGMDGVEFVERVAETDLGCGLLITSGLESNVLRAVEAIGESHGIHVLAALEKPLTARRLGEVLRQYTRVNQANPDRAKRAAFSRDDLETGLERGYIRPSFQPRMDLTTGVISSTEATGRWQIPDGPAVPPSVFIPALARNGLLLAFVERVVADACGLLDEAERADIELDGGMRVAIDLSLLPLSDASLADRLMEMVRNGGLLPGQFVWELDDIALARASRTAVTILTRLRVKGFGLSMRHSGTGPAMVSQLGRVPLTEIKLDERLVTAATDDPAVFAMLESSLASARAAGLRVVADGCDTHDTFDALLALGCSEAMGQFIGGPMPASDLVPWVLAGAGASVT